MTNYTRPCCIPYCNCTGACFAKPRPDISDVGLFDKVKKENEFLREQVKTLESKLDLILNTLEKLKD